MASTHLRTAWLVATFLAACESPSSDALCTDACQIWADCGDPAWYPFDTCFSECKAEGDWAPAYLSCLRSFDQSCVTLEDVCG